MTSSNENRLVSLDAYRGFVMLAMASGGLGIAATLQQHGQAVSGPLDQPQAYVWYNLAHHLLHRPWLGCSFWDLIQPSFMFMVGVSIPFSFTHRYDEGHSSFDRFVHVLFRSLILVLLGVFLQSQYSDIASFTFVNVLTQIGLGYPFVYLLMRAGPKTHMLVCTLILAGYAAFFHYAPAGAEQDKANTKAFLAAKHAENPDVWDEEAIDTEQFDDHRSVWNKHTNPSARFDRWLLNLFPRTEEPWAPGDGGETEDTDVAATEDTGADSESDDTATAEEDAPAEVAAAGAAKSFWVNRGGYQTLNFIPSIVTMLLGLMAGRVLLTSKLGNGRKFFWLLKASVLCFLISMALDTKIWPVEFAGADWSLCPTVKRIWTPTWTLFSAGWAFLLMAAFFLLLDILPLHFFAWPLRIVGMNSIVMYVMYQLIGSGGGAWLLDRLKMVLRTVDLMVGPERLGQMLGGNESLIGLLFGPDQPLARPIAGLCTLGLMWLVCLWLYKRKLFVRI